MKFLIQAAGNRRHHDLGYSPAQRAGFQKKRAPIAATTLVARKLFQMMDEDQLTAVEIGRKSGVYREHIGNCRRGKYTPRLDIFEAIANAAGYELVLVRRQNNV